MTKQLMLRLILVIFTLTIGSCSEERVHLVDQFYSYQTHNDLRPLIDSGTQVKGNKERISIITTKYSHLGEKGELGLLFYEDKLVAVGFYPVDSSAYLDKLENGLGIFLSNKDSIITHDKIISKGFDYEMGSIGGFYISWIDSNLANKYKGTIW